MAILRRASFRTPRSGDPERSDYDLGREKPLGPSLRRDDDETLPLRKAHLLLILYQRDDCKLCDEAIALLARASVPDFESVWIDGDAELETRYGERVPVLRDEASGCELGWPFDSQGLRMFLAEATGSRPSPG